MDYVFIRLKSKKEWATCLKTMWNMRMIGSKKISFWETESEAVMKILSVTGSPDEDNKGEVLNLNIRLEEGEILTRGGSIAIEMMDDTFLDREVKIINPQSAGDYAAVCEAAKQWKQSGKTLAEIKGPCECKIVVMNVEYHEVKTDEEIRNRQAMEEFNQMVCISPYKEINCGGESIYDNIEEGYTVPDKVIAYLRTTNPYIMGLGIYDHPFKKGVHLSGPYLYTDGYFCWDRDTWKYVVKYGLKLPQEFIDHVMSEAGTRFIESCIEKDESWSTSIKEWKKEQGAACFLPDDAGDVELEEF